MSSTRKIIIALMSVMFLCGCNLLEYPAYVIFARSRERVKAEYTGLKNTVGAVIVVTGAATDFDFPYARTNLALLAADRIAANVKGVKFIDQERLTAFQRNDLDWFSLPMASIGEKFALERIVYLDIIRFTMAEENSIGLLRGRITADMRIYDMQSRRPNHPCYQTEIAVVFPEHAPLAMSDSARQRILRETMLRFVEQLARKFYDHTVAAQ